MPKSSEQIGVGEMGRGEGKRGLKIDGRIDARQPLGYKLRMNAVERLRCRVPKAIKERFAALAKDRGLSESQLLRELIDQGLSQPTDSVTGERLRHAEVGRSIDRITIRLRPGDGPRLLNRAEVRGMKPSSYLAMLVRAHLDRNPPLPESELREVKRALAEIAGVGRSLRMFAKAAQAGDIQANMNAIQILSAINMVEQVRASIAALVRTHVEGWKTDRAAIPDSERADA